ncbi:MAG: single-stranded-DNA-specific exonuclease RecJ, partial [Anaerolineaceae bacterium]|nr:single-stranded-DNA-specific exonuclease RecJ [Anaerolineaceae bacterium]
MAASLKKRWSVADQPPADVDRELTAYSPVLRQLLYNRGICDTTSASDYLNATGSLHDPFLLLGMEKTAARLWEAIDQRQPVTVYGDFDADGVTATALMVQAINQLGGTARGYIPNRFEEGYGLNMDAVEQLSQESCRLLLTVDCGIRSPREVAHAYKLGMDVIISDHHEPRDALPEAIAVICPKQLDDNYPEKNLAGVGLEYKIVVALVSTRTSQHLQVQNWLDLVAVGTVSDVVTLTGENRSLVRAGLARLREGKRPGLRTLALAAGIQPQNLTARDIGFLLGPRLNAAGRLETARDAYELLMADDLSTAGILAQVLDNQNAQRQELTRQMVEIAERQSVSDDAKLIFSTDPGFNMGIVGLVASRLSETFYLPAIVGAVDGEFTRASCRSIPEFHITRALDECSEMMERHGGHAMAAGFTIRTDRLEALRERLTGIAHRELADQELAPILRADMEFALSELPRSSLSEIEA